MVLSKPDLIARIQSGLKRPDDYRSLSFSPEVSAKAIKQCSIDLRLGRIFSVFKEKEKKYLGSLRIQNAKDIFDAPELWHHEEKATFTLEPKEFVLTQTLEAVHLPHDLMGLVEGRSSWARLGISVHVTAPKIDPGFNAPITLELTNHSKMSVMLVAGEDQPCQLILVKLSKPLKPEEMYGASAEDIFADQKKPTGGKAIK
jgi:dCTP deaminase